MAKAEIVAATSQTHTNQYNVLADKAIFRLVISFIPVAAIDTTPESDIRVPLAGEIAPLS
jgi:hypothetical protein